MNCNDLASGLERLDFYLKVNGCLALRTCVRSYFFKIDEEQLEKLDLATAYAALKTAKGKRGRIRGGVWTCAGLNNELEALAYSVRLKKMNDVDRIDYLIRVVEEKKTKQSRALAATGVGDKNANFTAEMILLRNLYKNNQAYFGELYRSNEDLASLIIDCIERSDLDKESKITTLNQLIEEHGGKYRERILYAFKGFEIMEHYERRRKNMKQK